jgi:diguanylate cyclase (GGDEF)-like protein
MPETHSRRHRQPLDSLATKIILFVFVSTFATALVVSWTSIQSTHAYLSDAIDQQYPASASRARERLLDWIDDGSAELRELAQAGASLSGARLEKALAASSHFEGLIVQTPEGGVRHAAGPIADDAPGRERPSFATGRPGLQLLRAASGRELAAYAVRLGPADAAGGQLIGIFAAEAVETSVNAPHANGPESVLLVDGAGRVLFGGGGAAGTIPLADGTSAVRGYTNSAGIHIIGSSVPLGMSNWHVVVEAPFDVVFEPVVSVVKRVFVIDLCIILLFSYLAYKITTAIVRPIELLSDGARRIAQGQLDLEIPEPTTHDEIGLLARTFNDMMRKLRRNQAEIERANAKLRDQNHQLQQANEVLEQLSITDGLTKLHNHRFFHDHLTREIKRVSRVREPLSMILVDVDDFKALNDRFGHAAGDELLRRIAMVMNDSIRESDLLARYGGDEFVVLASDTDLDGAEKLAEKIRTTIAESSFIVDESLRPRQTTLSMGIARYQGTRKGFFAAADRALYRAKAQGKDCVVVDRGSCES